MSIAIHIPLLAASAFDWMPHMADIAAKGLAILLIASATTLLMQRASAAARHMVWCLGMMGLLALPLLSLTLPSWHVLPPWLVMGPSTPPQEAAPARPTLAVTPPYKAQSLTDLPPPAGVPPYPQVVPEPFDSAAATGARAEDAGLAPWLLGAWFMGAAAVMARFSLGLLSLWRIRRQSRQVTHGPWHALIGELAAELGLKRLVNPSPPRRPCSPPRDQIPYQRLTPLRGTRRV